MHILSKPQSNRKPTLRSLMRASASSLTHHPWALQQHVLQSLAASYRLQEDDDSDDFEDDPDRDRDVPDFPSSAE